MVVELDWTGLGLLNWTWTVELESYGLRCGIRLKSAKVQLYKITRLKNSLDKQTNMTARRQQFEF